MLVIVKIRFLWIVAVKFIWNCCVESLEQLKTEDGSGCILAHCMGLGKTLSVCKLKHLIIVVRFALSLFGIFFPFLRLRVLAMVILSITTQYRSKLR